MVASRTGQVPHVVRAIKRGVFKCDAQCQMYPTHKLCSHGIAVAEVHGKLEQLVHIHESGKFDPNVLSIVSIGMPSTSGKKPGQKLGAKQKQSKKQDPQTTSRFALIGSTSCGETLAIQLAQIE